MRNPGGSPALRRAREWSIVAAIALAYALVGYLGLISARERVGGWPTLWLPSVVGLGAVTLIGSRAAIGVGLGALLLRLLDGSDIGLVICSVAGNMAEALVGGAILRRRFGLPHRRVRHAETPKLVLTLALVTNISAALGIGFHLWTGRTPLADIGLFWWTWWAGNAGAVITLMPLILLAQAPDARWPRPSRLQSAGFAGGILLSSAVAFLGKVTGPESGVRLSLALLPVVIVKWAALTMGPFAVALGGAVVSLICGFATNLGHGPFATEDPAASFNACCAFLLLVGTTNLWLSILAAERRETQDLTERANQRLEQMVAQRTAELEERGRELQSFSYAVSHDLRAPLRGISGWIEALEEDCPGQLDDTGRAHLGRIQLEVDRLGSLIEGLLRLARIGTTEIRRSRVDLSDMAKRVILRLRQTDPDRAGDVQVEEGMSAWGDPALLDIALTNLLENAWKFSAKAEHPSIQFRTAGLHSRDQFVVVDNGAGFDPSNHRRLFIPFQRFHRQSEFPGTGIGLTTVQRIIRRHGGEIEVESRLGRGTTVRFSIPAVADTPFQNPPRP